MRAAARRRIHAGEHSLARRGGLDCQRPRSRKLASGHINFPSTSHRGARCRKSQKALGIESGVRRIRVGPLFHRWYEQGTGRYGRADPSLDRPRFHDYTYADSRPLYWIDLNGRKPTFPNPSLLIPPQIPCVGGVVLRAFLQGSLGPNGNRWAHCFASCGITRCAGAGAARQLGLRKEFLDTALCGVLKEFGSTRNTFCRSAFQPSDFEDNDRGITCPANQTCGQRCRSLEGRPDTAPGPFFG